jgi:hypothetical protein
MSAICREADMPSRTTVFEWMSNQSFSERIARARELGADAIAEEALSIADDGSFDTVETDRGPKMDSEWVARSKLRVETRLKLLAKWSPKKYGEKLDIEHTGAVKVRVVIGGSDA